MSTITIGVDLAKSTFSTCEVDGAGHVLRRQDLKRDAFVVWLAQVPAGTVVAMEACSGAHHWARRCLGHGLRPRLMAAQFITPFRKSRMVKNDRNDAEAIATAARQGNMRFVRPRMSTSKRGWRGIGCAKATRPSRWRSPIVCAVC